MNCIVNNQQEPAMFENVTQADVNAHQALFNEVSAKMPNWKARVDYTAPVPEHLVSAYVNAIEWFVGGPTKVTRQADGQCRFENAGYYRNIGA